MNPVILDTSVLLALLWQEPGWQKVAALQETQLCRI